MPDDRLRRTQYLESLARLQPSWVHESRSHLGNVSLQLDLLGELLPGADGVADATRLRAPIERARGGVDRLERCLDLYVGAARPRPAEETVDLAALLAEVGELVAPAVRDRHLSWSCVRATGGPGFAGPPAPRDVAAVREWLLIAAVEAVFGTSPGGSVEVRCEFDQERACVTIAAPGGAASLPEADGHPAKPGPVVEPVVRGRADGASREWAFEFALAGAGT